MYFTNTKYVLLHNLFVVGCIFYCCSLFCWIYSIWLWRTLIYPNKWFITKNHAHPIKKLSYFYVESTNVCSIYTASISGFKR